MKYAGGCFGCLTLIFIMTGVVLTLAASQITAALVSASPEAAAQVGPYMAYLSYLNSGCCCLSGVLAIVFLALGMSKKDDGSGE